jgi:hypothetical protein
MKGRMKEFILGMFVGTIFVMVILFGCLKGDQDEYRLMTEIKKTPEVKVVEVVGKKNVVIAGTPTGMIRIRGKF